MNRSKKPVFVPIASGHGSEAVTVAVYRCKLKLEELTPTANPEVKYCDKCARSVFRIRDASGLLQLVAADSCSWIDDGSPEPELGLIELPRN